MKKNLFLAFVILVTCANVFAQSDNRLMFLNKPVSATPNLPIFIAGEPEHPDEIFDGYYYRFVQFNTIPSAEVKTAMENTGLKILDYLPYKAFMMAIPVGFDRSLLSRFDIRCVVKQTTDQKRSQHMFGDAPAYAVNAKGYVDVRVQYQKNISLPAALQAATAFGKILSTTELTRIVEIRVKQTDINRLTEQPWLYFIDVVAPPSVKDDSKGRSLHRSNVINSDLIMGRHYNGSGVAAALADDGFVGPHIDFTGRITNHTTTTGQTHGDMTGGILAGAGNLNPAIRGMADGVQLHVFDIGAYPQIIDAVTNNATYGTVVSSTSYSQGCNEYTTDTQFGDQTLHDNNQLEFVFSAGNNNGADCGYGAGGNWGNITGGYKQGKNVIACANLDALEVIDPSSSIGPASDGRIKPDIASNGRDQMSTDENNTYQVGGGTSAACPGIAGICTQLIQAYKQLTTAPDAPTALIKACLLNSAEDIGNPGPDFKFGYGRVNALRAVTTLENNRYLSGTINQGGAASYSINIPANTAQMKVMLYWHDQGGNPAAGISLINDLDLTVTDPSSVNQLPWILDPTPNPVNLNTPAVRGIDHLNNIEQVTIDNPTPGSYTIHVNGFSIPLGPQQYYIVYEFRTDEITVTYPMGGEGFVPGEQEVIRWDALKGLGNFTLEYSTNNGGSWNTISSAVNQNDLQYTWTVPNSVTGEALVRVSHGSVSGTSSNIFSITGVPANFNVAWACVDSIRLSWANVPGAAFYEVSRLGSFYMDSIASTPNTGIVLNGTNPSADYWFSVCAVMPNGNKGRRAIAIHKQPGVFSCPNSAPYAQFTSSTTSSCPGKSISFIDGSANGPSSWLWTFTPNSVTFVNGTTATSQFPDVVFNTAGIYDVSLAASNSFGTDTETKPSYLNILLPAIPPVTEDFESTSFPPTGWHVESEGGAYTWEQVQNISGTLAATTTAAFVDNFSYNNIGAEDALATLQVDLGSALAARMTFDVAYARYSASYSDTLRIDLSTDCGNNYISTSYLKGGTDLATVPDQTGSWFPSTGNEWRNDTLDLSALLGQNVTIRFVNINGYGNSLIIDNVNVDITTGMEQLSSGIVPSVMVTPNPSGGLFTLHFETKNNSPASYVITDLNGKEVTRKLLTAVTGQHSEAIDLSNKSKGVYMLSLTTPEKTVRVKLVLL